MLKSPLLMKLPLMVRGQLAALLLKAAPALIMRSSTAFAPVAEEMVNIPLVPLPIMVESATVSA